MNNIKTYIAILDALQPIKASLEKGPYAFSENEKRIIENIYNNATQGLIENFYPTVNVNGVEGMEIGEIFIPSNTTKEITNTDSPEKRVPIAIKFDEVNEEDEEEPEWEENMEPIEEPEPEDVEYFSEPEMDFGEMEEPEFSEDVEEPTNPDDIEEPDEYIESPLTFEEEEDMEEPQAAEEAPAKERKWEPTSFPSEMHKEDFTFNFDKISLLGPNDEKINARIIVFPLSLTKETPTCIACAVVGQQTYTVKSDDTGKVRLDIEGHEIILAGSVDEDIFATEYILSAEDEQNGWTIEIKSKPHGSKGHCVLESEEIQIHILPVGNKNNSKDSADFLYYIISDTEEKYGDTNTQPVVTFKAENKTMQLLAKWKDDEGKLYCSACDYQE